MPLVIQLMNHRIPTSGTNGRLHVRVELFQRQLLLWIPGSCQSLNRATIIATSSFNKVCIEKQDVLGIKLLMGD
jgi:hypothetical protein